MIGKTGLKRSVFILLATLTAVVYSLAALACSVLVTKRISVSDISSSDSVNVLQTGTVTSSSDGVYKSASSDTASGISDISSLEGLISDVSSTESTSSKETQSEPTDNETVSSDNSPSDTGGGSVTPPATENDDLFTNAIWISFYELNFKNMNQTEFKNKVNTMFDNAVALKCDAVFVHVRPYADAFYRSSLFPMSSYVSGTQGVDPGYDPLKYMVTAAHDRGLEIHAWINPYRIAKSTDPSLLADSNMAKKWLTDGNPDTNRNVLEAGGGLYYNPTKPEVRKLIIDGVREILDNYDVDGIHMDDYFYPTTDASFDQPEYDAYKAASPNNTLSRGDWRRANVSALVSGIYSVVKQYNGVVFGISPSYSISRDKTDSNYNNQYADLTMWMKSDGYIDYITPQLYFGYDYPKAKCRFDYLLDLWLSIPRSNSVKLYIGLAAYKIGTSDNGSNEWQTVNDILSRQAKESYDKGCDGICIFSYSYITSNQNELFIKQRENLISMLDQIKK